MKKIALVFNGGTISMKIDEKINAAVPSLSGEEILAMVTGAMRSSSELGYDGPFNLATSICTAISEEAKGRGVLLCFNGELN